MASYNKGVKLINRDIVLNTVSPVSFPSVNDESVTINAGKIVIPSTITVNVEYSYNDTDWLTLNSSATNTSIPLDGAYYARVRLTKVSGSTNTITAIFGQGGSGGAFSFDGSTGALKVIAADAPKYENSTDQTASIGRKHLSTGTYSTPIVVRSAALEASHLIKASAGNLDAYRIEIAPSVSTGTYYIQFFNLGTLPPEGSAPDLLAPITVTHTTGTVSVKEKDFNDEPIFFSSGCYVVVSSTQFTKTIASAIMSINVQAS